jgi:hypothetical protein
MTSHLTHLRAQQHIAGLRRQADLRLVAMTDAQPTKPRRRSARRPSIVIVTGLQSASRLKRWQEWLAYLERTIRDRTAPRPATNKE